MTVEIIKAIGQEILPWVVIAIGAYFACRSGK
jgi:hypothetical protein